MDKKHFYENVWFAVAVLTVLGFVAGVVAAYLIMLIVMLVNLCTTFFETWVGGVGG